MNIREDIDWIKAELEKVRDPLLIEKVMDLLRSKGKESDQEAERMILEGLEDVENGNVFTSEEVGKEVDRWIKEK